MHPSIIMDQQQSADDETFSINEREESNNNNDNNVVKQSDFDVIDLGTDQELAKRQYDSDDDSNNVDGQTDDLVRQRKRLRDEASGTFDDDGEDDDDDEEEEEDDAKANGSNDSGLRPSGNETSRTNNESTNGYQDDEYSSNYSGSNGITKYEDGEHEHPSRQQHSEEPEQMRKLFIGGLDYKTSEVTLKQHFEKFGDVIDCVVMREPQSKRSRGFGFVIYASSSMVDKAQEARPHEVDGREVQSKRAISREDSGKPEAQATVKKVYLGGLSDDIEESELREYFKDFGNIVNVNIVAHRDTGKRRGFAFVEYDDYDPVDKIVLKKFHTIKDKRIEAKKAIPKVEMDARKRGDPRAAMAGAMIALSGPPLDGPGGRSRPGRSGFLWDGGPYSSGSYPAGYSSQASLDGYAQHYHSPSGHYGAGELMMHGGQGGSPYGFRDTHGSSAYGRNSYANQGGGNWSSAADYGGFPASQGGAGPIRSSYQHRGWGGPYGSGYGTHRGRGYNP